MSYVFSFMNKGGCFIITMLHTLTRIGSLNSQVLCLRLKHLGSIRSYEIFKHQYSIVLQNTPFWHAFQGLISIIHHSEGWVLWKAEGWCLPMKILAPIVFRRSLQGYSFKGLLQGQRCLYYDFKVLRFLHVHSVGFIAFQQSVTIFSIHIHTKIQVA